MSTGAADARAVHAGLLRHPDGRHRPVLGSWLQAAGERQDKILALAPPHGPDRLPAGVPAATLTAEELDPAVDLDDHLGRAVAQGFRGLGVVVWADNVIATRSAGFHTVVETALAEFCRLGHGSALCLYDPDHLGMAVHHHGDGLYDDQLTVRVAAGSLRLAGEIDADNLAVLDAALAAAGDRADVVRVDLTDVGFLSAGAAHRVAGHLSAVRARGGRVELRGARPHVRRVLRLAADATAPAQGISRRPSG